MANDAPDNNPEGKLPEPLISQEAMEAAISAVAPRWTAHETLDQRLARERADWISNTLAALPGGNYVCRSCGAVVPEDIFDAGLDPVSIHFRFHLGLRHTAELADHSSLVGHRR
jgi:hypothetical protein